MGRVRAKGAWMSSTERHVLGLSGGRDSAALAVYMAHHHPELEIEYFFTDTGKELPEVYEFLGRLEGVLCKPIKRLNPDRDFDFWLRDRKSTRLNSSHLCAYRMQPSA